MVKISICADCLALLANGEIGTEDSEYEEAHTAAMKALWGEQRLFLGGEPEGFSWASCDGCGSSLGGDRFAAHYDDREA
jgi:hypothetical protein